MFKQILFTALLILSFAQIQAQTARIEFDIKEYTSDTIIFGYYLADKMLIKDTLIRTDHTQPFVYEQDSLMESGMYLMVSVPEGMFYQVIVGQGEAEQQFTVTIDTTSQQDPIRFEGSQENDIFYNYLKMVEQGRGEIARLDKIISETDSTLMSVRDQLAQDKETINRLVREKQDELIAKHPNSIAALLVKSNLPFEWPEFTATGEELQEQRYRYYKSKYFDNIDLKHPSMLRTPIIDQRITYYLDNLTPIDPDSIIISVDYLLNEMDQDSDLYQYYLSSFLNKYGNSKYIGLDKVYVHLAHNYYGKGRAPWVTEENKREIVNTANRIAPVLIGKQAPDFTIQKEDDTPVSLSDFTKDYTVLIFWKPGCGHCTKAMPHVLEFNEKYKEHLDILAICTARGKDAGKCWEDAKKKGMDPLINAYDPFGKGRVMSKYYATSTPKIFILDKDKKILIKKVPAENLDAVMQQLMEMDKAKDAEDKK